MIQIPAELRPRDGRFGSGPSKVRPEAVAALYRSASGFLGTSHRHAGVRTVVARLKEALAELFGLPAGYEVVLGNGGSTAFWDALTCGLIERRSQHVVFGEFSHKCSEAVRAAPFLSEPDIIESEFGSHPVPVPVAGVDLYALTHNETSTGVTMPVRRVDDDGLVAVDATSAAGGLPVDPDEFDVYYFAPQKCFASDAGLWIALCSPRAIERIESLAASDRYIPPFLNLQIALENARKDQTYNTPALATLFLTLEQTRWILASGGLEWASARCAESSSLLYSWAEDSEYAQPFVKDPAMRSPVVVTIDLIEEVPAAAVAATLRANGILDTEPYRKLGRNQLRIATYPAIEPDDVELLIKSIDYVVEAVRGA
jgi:phosphoserine aminotransferase